MRYMQGSWGLALMPKEAIHLVVCNEMMELNSNLSFFHEIFSKVQFSVLCIIPGNLLKLCRCCFWWPSTMREAAAQRRDAPEGHSLNLAAA